jgi:hypothetical protein
MGREVKIPCSYTLNDDDDGGGGGDNSNDNKT